MLNFNPRAPCGARLEHVGFLLSGSDFNPRAPCGARRGQTVLVAGSGFISTHAPLAGRDDLREGYVPQEDISTHAPLAGRDRRLLNKNKTDINFNPRAPCGARLESLEAFRLRLLFQPTRPLRGATANPGGVGHGWVKISTHAPLAGRDAETQRIINRRFGISTHAPLAGRDVQRLVNELGKLRISTHAPLAGRDSKSVQINMHIFAITDKFQMLLHRMPPVRAFCSFLMQENHADLGANRPSDLCALVLRTIRSSVPRADTSACSRSVRFYSRTSCPSSKIEGCPFLGQ